LRLALLAQKEVSPKDCREKRDEYDELNNRFWRCGHRYQKESDNRCDVYGFFGVCLHLFLVVCLCGVHSRLTKKVEPPPTRGVNRDSGTASANGGWAHCWELHSGQSVSFTSILTADLAPESSSPSIPKRSVTTSC
jgi:hypothetical protein